LKRTAGENLSGDFGKAHIQEFPLKSANTEDQAERLCEAARTAFDTTAKRRYGRVLGVML